MLQLKLFDCFSSQINQRKQSNKSMFLINWHNYALFSFLPVFRMFPYYITTCMERVNCLNFINSINSIIRFLSLVSTFIQVQLIHKFIKNESKTSQIEIQRNFLNFLSIKPEIFIWLSSIRVLTDEWSLTLNFLPNFYLSPIMEFLCNFKWKLLKNVNFITIPKDY